MGIFSDWASKNVIKEYQDSPADKFKFSGGNSDGGHSDTDHPIDYEKARSDLFKLIMEKYPEETMRFFHDIGQRGDLEIKNLLSQIDIGKKTHEFPNPRNYRDRDEVVPSSADTAGGGSGGGGDGG
jgi:hypothetical protein